MNTAPRPWLLAALGSLLVSTLASLGPVAARAQDRVAPVQARLAISDCARAALDVGPLVSLLRLELQSDGVAVLEEVTWELAEDAAIGQSVALLRIDAPACAADQLVFALRIDDAATRKSVTRSVDLSAVAASARERALALAMSELLRASWAELMWVEPSEPSIAPPAILEAMRVRLRAAYAALGDPSAEPAAAEPVSADAASPAPPQDASASALPSYAVSASFVVRGFPGGRVAPLGARLALDLRVLEEWALGFDLEGALGTSLDPLGRIELGLATVGVSFRFVASIERVRLAIGPRLSGGAAWASGTAHDPTSVVANTGAGPVLTLGGVAELAVSVAEPLELRAGIEVQGVLAGLQAAVDGVPVAGIEGAGLGAWVGIAFGGR